MNAENLLDTFWLLHLSLGTINARSGLFANCIWIGEIFQAKLRDGGLLNSAGPLPVSVPSQAILRAKSEVQAQSNKESMW